MSDFKDQHNVYLKLTGAELQGGLIDVQFNQHELF